MKRDQPPAAHETHTTQRLLARLVALTAGGVLPDPLGLVRSHRELVERS